MHEHYMYFTALEILSVPQFQTGIHRGAGSWDVPVSSATRHRHLVGGATECLRGGLHSVIAF